MNRRPERLGDLLPAVVADLAARHHAANGGPMIADAQEVHATVFEVFVPGRPAPQGSKRHVGNGILVESSKALAPWRTTVAWHAAQVHRVAPWDGALVVQVEFVMPRPTGLPKRKATPPHTKRPDVDKLIRAVMDALSGVVWRDDSQVVDLHPTKRYAELDEQPGARIRVKRYGDAIEAA